MGDRVLIQMKDSGGNTNPVLYLHWRGYEADKWVKECAELMRGRDDDLPYAFARLVGIAHTHIDGNLSMGVWNQDDELTAEDSHGDRGCFVVECFGDWKVTIHGTRQPGFSAREPEEEKEERIAGMELQATGDYH